LFKWTNLFSIDVNANEHCQQNFFSIGLMIFFIAISAI